MFQALAADARGEGASRGPLQKAREELVSHLELQLRGYRAQSQLETKLAQFVVPLVTLQSLVTLDFVETLKSLESLATLDFGDHHGTLHGARSLET